MSDPVFIGVLIGLCLFAGVVLSNWWAPSIWRESNQWLVEIVLFGVLLFAGLVAQYWRFRRTRRFWAMLTILASIHAVVILQFVDYVRRIPLGGYIIILPMDAFGMVVLLGLFLGEHAPPDRRSSA